MAAKLPAGEQPGKKSEVFSLFLKDLAFFLE